MTDTVQATVEVESTGLKPRPYAFTAPAMVFHDVLIWMNENSDAGIRRGVSKDLQAECDIDRLEDNEEFITIRPTAKSAPELAQALTQLGLEVDLASVPVAERPSSNGTSRKSKEPTFCLYTGQPTSGGQFTPGRDMSLKGALLKIIDNASLGDTDTVVVGEGTAATETTVEQAIERLLSFPNWHYTEEGLRARRQKALNTVQERAEAKARREQEAADRKAAKAAPASTGPDEDDDEDESDDEE